ncbi:hypothetical protein [Defluviimonas salinarum]|uniref:Uncharacterized protein n=1 Tax=Defluviimonas salinarum TaxID=2992147 RepID=A0ABT3J5E7_9RHOB|nr:hypothetical protein [Defluviimonas salinarum]MCW3782911.1 hypothetical protein [Defluviimonas salinarum]
MLTFEDVIEEHRKAVGADKVHVSLGDEATPEGLRDVLAKTRVIGSRYAAYTDAEKAEAEVARLRDELRKIRVMTGNAELSPDERLDKIFFLADMVPDVDLDKDIAWMEAERRRKGIALPYPETA